MTDCALEPPPAALPPVEPATALPAARLRRWAREAAPPLLLYGVVCAVQLGLLALLRRPGQPSVGRLLLSWDGRLLLEVAEHGYPAPGPPLGAGGAWLGSNLAFFPLFPALVRAAHELTGLSFGDSALLASRTAGAVAAVLLHRLFARLYDRRTALFAVLLVLAQPMAVVLGMAYSEGVLLACAAGALLAAHRGAWGPAALAGALAGLTKPSGFAVGLALLLAAASGPRGRRCRPALPAALAACLATPGYLLWVGLRTGRLDGWFRIQRAGWGTELDWGRQSWDYLVDQLGGGTGWVDVSVALLTVAAVGGCLLALGQRPWPPLALYGVLVTALALGQSDYSSCKPRLLVPGLLFLLPSAVALGRARARTAWSLAGAAVLAGSWYGGYLLTIWQAVI
ncbi:glycosyltransferase family 39 protein [Kitasatospora viridis]|uniref:Dolichyl-phosphate-mannose-protein mannosyltransferase n=1 Tax=Kitasatospora viridis TaxID=281105 RepID=A0A561UQH9_9ACTN|nr:glycosyltransferase family 39 protein [Kitasatospora viridis]TWG01614.1 dolichyl-phosphate-mannose-protein mannosyltransferase [Kitasatospora viridis]